MIIGSHKDRVIDNIIEAVKRGDLNCKVEVDDPDLTVRQKSRLVSYYLKHFRRPRYRCSNICARAIIDTATKMMNRNTRIEGMENISGIRGGAIVTSNHFNPLDNTVVRYTANKAGYKRMFIVSQETNLAMKGFVGFLMNHADIIPIMNSKKYMNEYFGEIIRQKLADKHLVLIYPEQEMWFNYRKPRPPKRGAYYYAAVNKVPVISCFVEIQVLPELETEQFYKTQYVMHVLPPIYPDPEKSDRENSKIMMETDYRQKVEAYEQAYGEKLSYDFENKDIAGWTAQ